MSKFWHIVNTQLKLSYLCIFTMAFPPSILPKCLHYRSLNIMENVVSRRSHFYIWQKYRSNQLDMCLLLKHHLQCQHHHRSVHSHVLPPPCNSNNIIININIINVIRELGSLIAVLFSLLESNRLVVFFLPR